jgi:arylsulfatase A-like enzyme
MLGIFLGRPVLRLDRTLADLFGFIDKTVGLESTLIVLSADHGTPEAPEYMTEKGMHAGRLNLDSLDYSELDAELKKRFDIGKEVIKMTFHPYVYLDRGLIQKKTLKLEDVSRVVASELIEIDGIAYAIPSTDLAAGRVPDASPIARQVLRNFNPKRSGDVYIIYEPHWGATYSKDVAVVNHGSPWVYDTYVPIFFAGQSISSKRISRRVETVDIAPTLSACLDVKPPSCSVGHPLIEVLRR